MSLSESFARFAKWTARTCGHPSTFGVAVGVILLWAITGPIFRFSDTWQLFINTATTIITFLMVFLIQNTQNRDGAAVQLKLDELIRAMKGAQNSVLSLEEMSEEELERLKAHYSQLAEQAQARQKQARQQTESPPVRRGGS
jgi:low affinity Fe/Cu permease